MYGQYYFNIFGFNVKQDAYREWLRRMFKDINRVGKISRSNDLAVNLLIWATWQHSEPTDNDDGSQTLHTISFDADALNIMWTDIIIGTIANVDSDCKLSTSTTLYDRAVGIMNIQFDMSMLASEESCRSVIDPHTLGYSPDTDGNIFTFSIDVHTLYAALAQGFLLNGPNTLDGNFQRIDTIYAGFVFLDVTYNIDRYYDPQNPQMDPMYCFGPANTSGPDKSDWNCVIPAGNTFGVPFFLHTGVDQTSPVKCDCTMRANETRADSCDRFDFLTGVIVYDVQKNQSALDMYPPQMQPFIPMFEFFYLPLVVTMQGAQAFVYTSAWVATVGQALNKSALWKNESMRNDLYDFTWTPSFGTASLVVFRLYSTYDKTINANNRQLVNGACFDSFDINETSMQQMMTRPWGPLEESYTECVQSLSDALLNATGVSRVE